MSRQISITIPTSQFLEVVDFIREEGSDRDPVDVISDFIDQGLILARNDPNTFLHYRFDEPETESRGYLWKHKDSHLFLPHGTSIRMNYKGRVYTAVVEGDAIIYEGKSYSPANLVNTITSTSRNAWRDLWIKKPGQTDWLLADNCRGMTVKIDGKDIDL